jgi:hypothetical protein
MSFNKTNKLHGFSPQGNDKLASCLKQWSSLQNQIMSDLKIFHKIIVVISLLMTSSQISVMKAEDPLE